jgi:DNA invertase Pin-like site-specific DNA recombinase
MGTPIVCYYRVSTQRQGRSGLGLEAQRWAVWQYLKGGDWRIVAELIEVESGKRSDRPRLAKALKVCRAYGARLRRRVPNMDLSDTNRRRVAERSTF